MVENTLKCSRCKETLPLERFYVKSSVKRGFSNNCRECHQHYVREYRKKNPSKDAEVRSAWRRRYPEKYAAQLKADRDSGRRRSVQ